MSLFDVITTLIALYLAYCVLRWVVVTTLTLLARGWERVDPRSAARTKRRMRRIVCHTKEQQRALGEIIEEEMRAISDAAAKDILRR